MQIPIPTEFFVGIDQSLTNTGVTVLYGDPENKRPIILDYTSIKSKWKGIERIYEISEEVLIFVENAILSSLSYTKKDSDLYDVLFAVEGYSYNSGNPNGTGKKYSRLTQAGEIKIAIELSIYRKNYLCVSYAPNSHRSKTIGYLKGNKNEIVDKVNKLYNCKLTKSQHNIADSMTIAHALFQDVSALKVALEDKKIKTEKVRTLINKTTFKHLSENQLRNFFTFIRAYHLLDRKIYD